MRIGKNISKIVFAATLLLATSCSVINEDVEKPGNTQEPTEKPDQNEEKAILYLHLNLSLPVQGGTRASSTDPNGSSNEDPDYFDGVYNENIISGLKIYFCEYDVKANAKTETPLLTLSYRGDIDFNTDSNGTATTKDIEITIPVEAEELQVLQEKERVRVYATANMNGYNASYVVNDVASNTFDAMSAYFRTIDDTNLHLFNSQTNGKKGWQVPVASSKSIDNVSFTNLKSEDLNTFINGDVKSEEFSQATTRIIAALKSVMSEKTIELERLLVRIDYRDKSSGNFLYPLHEKQDHNCKVKLKLLSMTPFNISKMEYVFRHTAEGNAEGAAYNNGFNIQLFGNENDNNDFGQTPADGKDVTSYRWILDADAEYKRSTAKNWSSTNLGDHFYNIPEQGTNSITSNIKFTPTEMKELVNSNSYSYSITTTSNEAYSYYPWIYLTENTLPSTEAMIRGLSTGIAFKTLICNEEGIPITDLEALKTALKDGDNSTDVIVEQIGNSDRYTLNVNNNETIMEAVKENGKITGFLLTYWYFFRHNVLANHKDGTTDPMQFALVRNNIYRIAVTGFDGIPTPYNPEDPDEPQTKACIAVEIKVLPWVKRELTVGW